MHLPSGAVALGADWTSEFLFGAAVCSRAAQAGGGLASEGPGQDMGSQGQWGVGTRASEGVQDPPDNSDLEGRPPCGLAVPGLQRGQCQVRPPGF